MTKEQIDNSTYYSLLSKWRFARSGDPTFTGDLGEYFRKVMNEKKAKLSHDECVQISKDIGW